jgi:diguanylate cyclase (GGDEF)-like protein
MISSTSKKNNIIFVILLSVFFPVVFGYISKSIFSNSYANIPLHSGVEVAGGVIAITIAMMIYIKFLNKKLFTYLNYTTVALLVMGIVDIFHGIVMPGEVFVWLHSTAVFFGGILFVSVWFKQLKIEEKTYKLIPMAAIVFAVVFSLLSMVFYEYLPQMLNDDKSFTSLANLLNIIGGIGFFIASVKFLKSYIYSEDIEDLLFAGHTLLFGVAGILFVSSQIWDAQWWLWHILRLSAYCIALYFLYLEFDRDLKLIETAAITDGLTKIYNRRYFNEMFPTLVNSAKREHEYLGFVMLDIDHFKLYNDNYGHKQGDDALIQVAKIIQDSLKRSDDYCFRLGGEEFAVIFKTQSHQQALEFANTIRLNIKNLQLKHEYNSSCDYLTASLGLLVIKSSNDHNMEELYQEADKYLYTAKENGRNRVCVNEN